MRPTFQPSKSIRTTCCFITACGAESPWGPERLGRLLWYLKTVVPFFNLRVQHDEFHIAVHIYADVKIYLHVFEPL